MSTQTEKQLHTRIPEILAGLAVADTEAETELGQFHLRQDRRGRVIGDFYKCRLSSVFQPVFGAAGRNVIGHEARVRCDSWGDEAVSPWGIFSMIARDSALVRLDRLCRTLHTLNYFSRAQADWMLFLRVEPRLLTSVKQDHGRVFGEALRQCGITTSRIVIEIPVEALGDSGFLERVVENYQSRGYRVATYHSTNGNVEVFDEIRPEFLKIDPKRFNADQTLEQVIDRVHCWGGRAIASQIETARDLVVAERARVDFLQGFYAGRPDFDITTHHGLGAVPQTIITAVTSGSSWAESGNTQV